MRSEGQKSAAAIGNTSSPPPPPRLLQMRSTLLMMLEEMEVGRFSVPKGIESFLFLSFQKEAKKFSRFMIENIDSITVFHAGSGS